MQFNYRSVGEYSELIVNELETGLMDKQESVMLAQHMISVAAELLYGSRLRDESDSCGEIVEDLNKYL